MNDQPGFLSLTMFHQRDISIDVREERFPLVLDTIRGTPLTLRPGLRYTLSLGVASRCPVSSIRAECTQDGRLEPFSSRLSARDFSVLAMDHLYGIRFDP